VVDPDAPLPAAAVRPPTRRGAVVITAVREDAGR
jgi:hypothetical protein